MRKRSTLMALMALANIDRGMTITHQGSVSKRKEPDPKPKKELKL